LAAPKRPDAGVLLLDFSARIWDSRQKTEGEAMPVGIVKDDVFLEHVIEEYHPENPQRLVNIYAMLAGLDQSDLLYAPRRVATREEIAAVHDGSYIESIARTEGKDHTRLDPDTSTSPRSYEAACIAAGGVLELADMLVDGRAENGFALVRPPGHHAERNKAMGFCIFNNIAIGARYLEQRHGLKKIVIVDFDLHHGNGTQHSFYEDATVLYFSTHQYPYYPGTGRFEEVGSGPGKGFTANLPLSYGMGDDDYVYALEEILIPLCDRFEPQAVLVSAGFDAYYNDPLGGMSVTEEGYAAMTRLLLGIAARHCGGKALFALEGGYDLKGLAGCAKSVILALKRPGAAFSAGDAKPSNEMVRVVGRSKEVLEPYWGKL
jgi:acetoin utilization deacetylase AcuC-like enzyme